MSRQCTYICVCVLHLYITLKWQSISPHLLVKQFLILSPVKLNHTACGNISWICPCSSTFSCLVSSPMLHFKWHENVVKHPLGVWSHLSMAIFIRYQHMDIQIVQRECNSSTQPSSVNSGLCYTSSNPSNRLTGIIIPYSEMIFIFVITKQIPNCQDAYEVNEATL